MDAGDEDQAACPPGPHGRPYGLGHPQCPKGVELEQPLDLSQRNAFQRRAHGLTGVADQHVDVTGVPDSLVDAVLIGDVNTIKFND